MSRRLRRSASGGLATLATFVAALGSATARAEPPAPPAAPSGDPATPPPVQADVVPPRLSSEAQVAYPLGGTGDAVVVLAVTVNADGTVRAVRILEGDEPFVGAALETVPTWRFEPATRAGQPISAIIRFEVAFHAPVVAGSDGGVAPPAGAAGAAPGARPASGAQGASPGGTATTSTSAAAEVTVRGERAAPMVSSLSRAEVRQLPGAFGDPFRAIEALPGVTPVVSGLPFFYVRGAPPGNVGYFFDGVRVPYLYHVGLGPSVVHPGLVDRVDLYPGGYPARYGRFAGGIVAGETTAPRDDLHGEGNIRLFDAGALAETGFAGGRGTVLVGGRYSYTAAILSLVAKDVALDYRDYQLRATYDLTPQDRISVLSFGSYDLLGQKQNGLLNILFGSEFHRLDARYDHSFGKGSTLRLATTVGYDRTHIADQRNASDRMIGARAELYHPLGDHFTLRGGVDTTVDSFAASGASYADPEDPNTIRYNNLFPPRSDLAVGGWSDVVMDLGPRIQVTPGVRVDLYGSGNATALAAEPRISARLGVTKGFRFVQAYGLAHQAPAFIVPVPGLTPANLQGGLQRAIQTSAGVEIDLPDQTTLTANLFHNAFYDMSDTLGTVSATGGNILRSLSERSSGSGIGLEAFLHRRLTKRLGGFLSYTLSRSTRNVGSATFPSTFDRTHVANGVIAYDLGKNWRAGTRLVFYTGIPKTTPARGLIVPAPPQHPDREPAFYRVDLRLEKRWTYEHARWLSFVVECLNATASKEVVAGQTIGPVTIPSIGLEGGF